MGQRRNLLLFLVDQWPAHEFTRLGSQSHTPNADRLAAAGTVFDNAFTSCPLCSPARAALLTGRWAHQTGLYDNCGVGYSMQDDLSDGEQTWIGAAARRGFHVGYFGKWHLGANGPQKRGAHEYDANTDSWVRTYEQKHPKHSYTLALERSQEDLTRLKSGKPPFYGIQRLGKAESEPVKEASKGVDFISRYSKGDQERPFFLTVSTVAPHFPHYLPAEYEMLLHPESIKLPENIRDPFDHKPSFHSIPWWPSMDTAKFDDAEWRKVIAYTLLKIRLTDEALGMVLDALDETGLSANTDVVFLADHGDMNGAHNRFDKGPYFYEEVWRIPLIIHQPGKPTAVNGAFVNILDVGKTLLSRVQWEEGLPKFGRDLSDLIGTDSYDQSAWPKRAYGAYDLYNGMSMAIRAIRDDRYKYCWNPQEIDELYDLETDPGEINNLIPLCTTNAALSAIKVRLKDELLTWMDAVGDPLLETSDSLPAAGTILVTGEMGP